MQRLLSAKVCKAVDIAHRKGEVLFDRPVTIPRLIVLPFPCSLTESISGFSTYASPYSQDTVSSSAARARGQSAYRGPSVETRKAAVVLECTICGVDATGPWRVSSDDLISERLYAKSTTIIAGTSGTILSVQCMRLFTVARGD